ncbi:adenosylcobinamide amidohydrolase [Paenibacillus flagellatus]|nr:adenosylcobinamide amidohydrolase [Paenibacillus flagellatus]
MKRRTAPASGVSAAKTKAGDGGHLTVKAEFPLYALNSSVWGGGFRSVRTIVNRQVAKSYMCDDPEAEMETYLRRHGFVPDDTAAMLTAAFVEEAGECHLERDGLIVSAWVTAGLGNTARAGTTEGADRLYPGTINTIVVVDGRMTEAALVNAVITATEAKTAALQDLRVTAGSGTSTATGTTTDAVVIASTGRGERYRYAGTATTVGFLIGASVYEATAAACRAYRAYRAGSPG